MVAMNDKNVKSSKYLELDDLCPQFLCGKRSTNSHGLLKLKAGS